MITIGVTGGIGSGKSYICSIFEYFGLTVYNADIEAKQMMISDQEVINKIKAQFGEESYLSDWSLNREFLAKEVFGNSEKLLQLNSIVHPALLDRFKQFVGERNSKAVIMEAAILIESGFHKEMDVVVVVTSDLDMRIERVIKRDGVTLNQVLQRMDVQMSNEDRESHADYIIRNGENELVLPQILEFLQKSILL